MKRVAMFFIVLLISISVFAERGNETQVTIGPSGFSQAKYKKILVLPFLSSGNNAEPDVALAQQFADNLKQMGFAVFDVNAVADWIDENGIEVKKCFTKPGLALLKKKYNFDAAVRAVTNYKFTASRYDPNNPFSAYIPNQGGGYDVLNQVVKFYSPAGEVLITLSCPKLYMANVTDEISLALEDAIGVKSVMPSPDGFEEGK